MRLGTSRSTGRANSHSTPSKAKRILKSKFTDTEYSEADFFCPPPSRTKKAALCFCATKKMADNGDRDFEKERLRAELDATRQQLAQAQSVNANVRQGEVVVPIAEGVAAPGEATPLNPNGLPRQHSVVAMGKAVQDNKLAAGGSTQTCMGIVFAVACLCIYYLNGGDSALCSTKLPLFLKVNGFVSIAYILTTAILVYLSTRGKLSSEAPSFKGLACLTSVVGCFLFAWFICGLVRPRHLEQCASNAACIRSAPVAAGVVLLNDVGGL